MVSRGGGGRDFTAFRRIVFIRSVAMLVLGSRKVATVSDVCFPDVINVVSKILPYYYYLRVLICRRFNVSTTTIYISQRDDYYIFHALNILSLQCVHRVAVFKCVASIKCLSCCYETTCARVRVATVVTQTRVPLLIYTKCSNNINNITVVTTTTTIHNRN